MAVKKKEPEDGNESNDESTDSERAEALDASFVSFKLVEGEAEKRDIVEHLRVDTSTDRSKKQRETRSQSKVNLTIRSIESPEIYKQIVSNK